MVGDNRELVQHEVISRVLHGDLSNQELWGGVLEGVWFLGCCRWVAIAGFGFGRCGWFFGEGWAVAELELLHASERASEVVSTIVSIYLRVFSRCSERGVVTGIPKVWMFES